MDSSSNGVLHALRSFSLASIDSCKRKRLLKRRNIYQAELLLLLIALSRSTISPPFGKASRHEHFRHPHKDRKQ